MGASLGNWEFFSQTMQIVFHKMTDLNLWTILVHLKFLTLLQFYFPFLTYINYENIKIVLNLQ